MEASSLLHWYHLVAILIFLWASYHQHVCHKILASLRTATDQKGGKQRYSQPDGDWFELVSSPHFLAEILIYMAMMLCFVVTDVWTSWWLILVYLVSTLGLSARQTHTWYKQKFEDYPTHRYAMLPWIL